MALLKLKPGYKDYLWGGRRLIDEYHKQYDGEILAESWELSCHPDGPSIVENGYYKGKTFPEYIKERGREILGTHCRYFQDFPILIKFIDARKDLSVQVHPDNSFAMRNEGQYGKTEMWYVVDCEEDAFLYYGFREKISHSEFEQRIQNDTLLEVLNAVPVQKGDVLFIEAGTIHAIGKNIVIAEIQQNSNVTYRVYDYGRIGPDGRKRDLHIEKALAVTKRIPVLRGKNSNPHLAKCDYFMVDKLILDNAVMKQMKGIVDERSFVSVLFMEGKGTITCQDECLEFQKGDSFFIEADSGEYTIEGSCEALVTAIGNTKKKKDSMIGYDVFPDIKRRCVTFSFDGGHSNDGRLMALLDKYEVAATFYKDEENVMVERHPNCHYHNALETCEDFLRNMRFLQEESILHIWGRSSELISEAEWETLEGILKLISKKRNIWYADNFEVYQYIAAQKSLMISEDEKVFYNPSEIDVWIQRFGNESFCIPAGRKIDMKNCE